MVALKPQLDGNSSGPTTRLKAACVRRPSPAESNMRHSLRNSGPETMTPSASTLARSSAGLMAPSQSLSTDRKASRTERRCSQRAESMRKHSAASTSFIFFLLRVLEG